MEAINTETDIQTSGYEYTHADGTVQRVESAEQARSVCPVLGKMAIEQASLLLELSALGQGIIDQQKEQQAEPVQDSAAENQLIAPVAEAKKPETTNQPESNIYSDSSGYRPVGAIKTEQSKPKIDTEDVAAPTESSPELTPNNTAKTPSEVKSQNIPEKPLLKTTSTDHEEINKVEQPIEETPGIIKISPVSENSLDSNNTEATKNEPYAPDLILIPLEIPTKEITDNIENPQEIIAAPIQEVAPKLDEMSNKPQKTEIITTQPTPIKAKVGVISAHEKPHKITPINEPSPTEVSEYSKPESEPITETIIKQVTELTDEQINSEDILISPVITDIIEITHDLQESIETNASDEQIESLKTELTTKLTLLFEELGIEIKPKEIEKLIIEITKNTPESTELTEYLPVDDIDLENSGTHEVKRSLSQFISNSVDTAERDIKHFIGKVILRYVTAES